MKKILGLTAAALLAFGSFGVAFAGDGAPGGSCDAPLDGQCTTQDDEGNDITCDVYLAAGTDLDGCINVDA